MVPSLTETICRLGKRDHVVGCTQFCVRPPDLHRTAVLVGGTKDPNLSTVADLSPDLIVVNSEENRPEDIHRCRSITQVLETFPKSPRDVPNMLRSLGEMIAAKDAAEVMVRNIEEQINFLDLRRPGKGASFAYFVWKNPYMVASKDTYISRCLELAGFRNVVEESVRYPSVDLASLKSLAPDMLLLGSEPFPFRQRDVADIASEFASPQRIMRIDGQLMSWYGSITAELLQQLMIWPNCEQRFLREFQS